MHFIFQPLNRRTRNEHTTFQSVGNFTAEPHRDGRQQLVFGHKRLSTGVRNDKTSRTVGALGHAVGESCLTDQRGLLIARHPENRNLATKTGIRRDTELRSTVFDLGQHLSRHTENLKQLVIPLLSMNIE